MDKAYKTDKVQEKDGYVVWNRRSQMESSGVCRPCRAAAWRLHKWQAPALCELM